MWTGIILLDLMKYYYDTQRVLRIIAEDGQPELMTINEKSEGGQTNNDFTVGSYDVVMDTGPGYATKREEAAENMMELLNTKLGDVIVATRPDIPVRNMDFHGADVLADSLAVTTPQGMEDAMKALPKQAQTIVQSLQGQLQKAQETIQQQSLELKYGASIQQMKEGAAGDRNVRDNQTKVAIAEMQVEKDLHVEDSKSATSRDVAEIHGATQLLNTKAESEHEERQSDALIAAGTKDRKPGATAQ
jgi:hypothetical protein